MMSGIFPRNNDWFLHAFIIDTIVQSIFPFLIGALIGFFVAFIVISRRYKHTEYYKHRVLASITFAMVPGVISFCVLDNYFSHVLYNLTSYVRTIVGW